MKKRFGMKSVFRVGMALFAVSLLTVTDLIAADVIQVTVTGAGKGANAYRAMAAVAEAVNQTSKTVQATNRESGGFVEGTRLVAANRVQIAMTSGPFVDFWQRKISPFDRDTGPRDTIRGMGPHGDAPFLYSIAPWKIVVGTLLMALGIGIQYYHKPATESGQLQSVKSASLRIPEENPVREE